MFEEVVTRRTIAVIGLCCSSSWRDLGTCQWLSINDKYFVFFNAT